MLGGEKTIEEVFEKQIKFTRSCSLKMPKRYLKRFSGSMMEALRMMSPGRCRRKVASSSSESGSKGSGCAAAAGHGIIIGSDHRAEAIDDCIQFINSSLSLSRSNSISC